MRKRGQAARTASRRRGRRRRRRYRRPRRRRRDRPAVAACSPQGRASPADELVAALAQGPSHPEGPALVDRALGRALVDAVTAAGSRLATGRPASPRAARRTGVPTAGSARLPWVRGRALCRRIPAGPLAAAARRRRGGAATRRRRPLGGAGRNRRPRPVGRWRPQHRRSGRCRSGGDRDAGADPQPATAAQARAPSRRRQREPCAGRSGRLGGLRRPRRLRAVRPGASIPASSTGDRAVGQGRVDDYPDEAEALTGKAQELMTRHAIDVAAVEAERGGGARVRAAASASTTLRPGGSRCSARWPAPIAAGPCGRGASVSPPCSATRATSTPSRSSTPPARAGQGDGGRPPSRYRCRRRAAPSGGHPVVPAVVPRRLRPRIGDRLRQVAEATAAEAAAGPEAAGSCRSWHAGPMPPRRLRPPPSPTEDVLGHGRDAEGWLAAGRPPIAPTSGPTACSVPSEGRRRRHWGRPAVATGRQEAMGSGAGPLAPAARRRRPRQPAGQSPPAAPWAQG